MKILLLFFTFFALSQSFAQVTVNDLGKISYDELKKKEKGTPCEDNEIDELTYCLEGENKVYYFFQDEVLFGMTRLTYYTTKNDAEKRLQQEIARSKSLLGVPLLKLETKTVFTSLEKGLSVFHIIEFDEKSKSWVVQELVSKN